MAMPVCYTEIILSTATSIPRRRTIAEHRSRSKRFTLLETSNMWRNRKRRYSEAANSGGTNRGYSFEERRRRSESDKWSHDSRSFSPKRRRLTDTRGGESKEEAVALGYKALEEIWKADTDENRILELDFRSERFQALLRSKTEINPGVMKLTIFVLQQLCCTRDTLMYHVEQLLRLVIETNFMRSRLSGFISRMLSYTGSEFDKFQSSELISSLTEVFLYFLQRFGHEVAHEVPVFELENTLLQLKAKRRLHDAGALERKVSQVKELRQEIIDQEVVSIWDEEDHLEVEPPHNFRELSVFPKAADLSVTYNPFLRVNVVDQRGYTDREHYLDVQFRLVREDFIIPLREAIMELRRDSSGLETSTTRDKERAKDVYFYRDVTVLYPVCHAKGMVYRIRFDASHHSVRKVPWERSKRFKNGSLLCLAMDDFYTPLFATVESRDPKELCLGELDVRFEGVDLETLNGFMDSKTKFDMVESKTFFEAYRYVLEGLKEIGPGDLPFEEHIVKCKEVIGPPDHEYQTNFDYNISGIIQDEMDGSSEWRPFVEDYSIGDRNSAFARHRLSSERENLVYSDEENMSTDSQDLVNALDLHHYRDSLGFNDAQLRAFQLALTKKFAVIQGPPGTGKTYVGLKIARVLLETASLWEEEGGRTPILMVSYTNHALDQFLEGLLPMQGIVRVGGRSKSEKLEPNMLHFVREQARENKKIPGRITRARTKANKKIRKLKEDGTLDLSILVMKLARRGILSFNLLKDFMQERHVRWFEKEFYTHDKQTANDFFCKWLGVEKQMAAKDLRDRDDYDLHNEDFQMQVSFRTFADEDDPEEEGDLRLASKPSDVLICETNDSKRPSQLQRNLQTVEVMSEGEEKRIFLSQGLAQQQRWKLYRLWLQRAEKKYLRQIQEKQPEFEKFQARLNELRDEEDLVVLKNARVIGMTTTCAGKRRHILQRIRPKIVIVEEAAEVFEAHIITSLTPGCQHLILIGDQQQLRPTPAVHDLAKRYKLDVSLFERMVNVGIQCEMLNVQHRMRPEIAVLMKHIYDDLENHESVEEYEDVKGIKKNMFFINHGYVEESCNQSHSHVNEHEAKFLVALCRYLLQQGYKADQITLLTTYMGQMFAIRESLKAENDHSVRGVRVTTVDNFQGEENDIILLSLVRSNKDEKIGFLKIVNRACVALSRAKKGFYCIGNFDLLFKHSEIWRKIVTDLKASGRICSSLQLVCQIHHAHVRVKLACDFRKKVPNGGCQRECKVRLECGHTCKQLCHPDDVEHEKYKCAEPCRRTIKGCSHKCPNLCFEACKTNCPVPVRKMLPLCGHINTMECGQDTKKVKCREKCENYLPKCGHQCQNLCREQCTKKCEKRVKRRDWPCGHDVTVACSAKPDECPVRCSSILECGHQCSGTCGECRMGRIHKRCNKRCDRLLVCLHECKESCIAACPPCSRPCENRCVHNYCARECGQPCVPCSEECTWECPHHKCYKLCGELCNRPRCNVPCNKIIKCGRRRHICCGLCGEQCICTLCDTNDGSRITDIFFGDEDQDDARFIKLSDCGHIFEVTGLDKYMDDDENRAIKLKSCPRCLTPIRTSLRYSNVIKQQLYDIEKVRIRTHGHPKEMIHIKQKLKARLTDLKTSFGGDDEMETWKRLKCSIKNMTRGTVAAVTENQLMFMEKFCVMRQELDRCLPRHAPRNLSADILLTAVQKDLEYLKNRFMSKGVTERELRDIRVEFSRQNLQLELCLLRRNTASLSLKLKRNYRETMTSIQDELSSGRVVEEERLDMLMGKLGAIRRAYPALSPLTPEEKTQIVTAMNFEKGHWFKCPNGHAYVVGECGGPIHRTTCPDCRVLIGGSNHRLEEGNQLACEMDGARRKACKHC